MLLAPGTTLQSDKYVIDALLEDAENGALYWGTQISTDSPVYIQRGAKLAESTEASTASLHSTLLEASQPSCVGIVETFMDGQHPYMIMTPDVGQPWSHRQRYNGPLPPKQALMRVQQVVTGLLWLMDQGVTTVDLAPNRVWWPDDDTPAILSGWSRTEVPRATDDNPSPNLFNPLPALATLLGSFLIGHGFRPHNIVSDLAQQEPEISPRIMEAIQFGLESSPPPRSALVSTVTAWLQSLPLSLPLTDAQGSPTPAPAPPNRTPLTRSQSITPSPRGWARPSPGFALTLTALVAALTGLSAGMVWRLNLGPQPPGGPRFSPDQGFPALSNWAGEAPVETTEQIEPRDRGQPSQFPENSLLVNPDALEGIPERWASPVNPWEPLNDSAPLESGPRLPNRVIEPQRPSALDRPQDRAPTQPTPENNPLQENPEPDPTLAEPTAPTPVSPVESPPASPSPVESSPASPPAKVTPAPAPTPDLSTAES